jgi:ABC-2 type transport system ATP-binding protein
MEILVEADRLRKTFGSITAVDSISLRVAKGEVLGFLGPNGAGKSTTMKMLTGFLEPDIGTARICGISVVDRPKDAKARLGYLPEGAPAYGDMTARAFLNFIAAIRGFSGADKVTRVEKAVRRTGLEDILDQRIDTLSKGFKRRVGLAQAILHEPSVLIMDEPTDGLDPNQKHHVRALITEMAKDKAIIVSTHILEEVEAVCTRAVVIDRGNIVANGTAEDLQRRLPYHNAIAIRVTPDGAEAVMAALNGVSRIAKVEQIGPSNGTSVQVRITPKDGASIASDVAAVLSDKAVTVSEMYVERGKLDDVFRQITSHEGSRQRA